MNRFVCLTLLTVLSFASTSLAAGETLNYGRFGTLTLYRESPQPAQVVLFVSGDGGWNLGVIDMARSLAKLDALVVGIDITHYLKQLARSGERCSYPAADFENLSKFVQKKLGLDRYRVPVLVGYSSGATLVYALLAQAPPDTFRGAISMGFCPDLPLNKPFCAGRDLKSRPSVGSQGFDFLPAPALPNPWIAFQGTIDQVCSSAAVETYVKQVRNGEVVLLPKVGHGFSVQRHWLPQFRQAFQRLISNPPETSHQTTKPAGIADLPLVSIPAQGQPRDLLAVIVSGDGGWASIDRELGGRLAGAGIDVVGFNSLQYFWTPRTPETTSYDLARVLRHALAGHPQRRVVLIGYSFGAEVLPFMAGRLPADLKQRVALVTLLSPGQKANFEFHLGDWLGGTADGLPVAPELAGLKGLKVLCGYGRDEKDGLCQALLPGSSEVRIVPLEGGHHFGGAYDKLADMILTEIRG